MGKIFNDEFVKAFDPDNPEHLLQAMGAINYYLGQEGQLVKAAVQEYSTNYGATPTTLAEVIAKFHQMPETDLGWTSVFDVVDLRLARTDSFEIRDIQSGIAFEKYIPGEAIDIRDLRGERTSVFLERYGAAVGFDRQWFHHQKFWAIEEVVQDFLAKEAKKKAQYHYDLLSAARADSDVAWQGSSGQSNAERDAQTIDAACQSIITELEDLGMDADVTSQFVIITPIQLLHRLNNAIKLNVEGDSSMQVYSNIKAIVPTTKLKTQDLNASDSSHFMVALPGRKIKSGISQDLKIEEEIDILRNAVVMAGNTYYGAAVGETGQLRRCTTS